MAPNCRGRGRAPWEVQMLYVAGLGIICGTGFIVLFLKKRSDKGNTTISVR